MYAPEPSSDDPLPGSVSNQNQEEAEPGHGGEGKAPGSEERRRRHDGEGGEDGGGESKEGSQSTGDPRSAG